MQDCKIGIATHYSKSCNYGGLLQAYALCSKLNSLGYSTKQIDYEHVSERLNNKLISSLNNGLFFEMLKSKLANNYNQMLGRIHNIGGTINSFRSSFASFREGIPHTDTIYNNRGKNSNEFDIYITGSDQVWNIGASHYFSDFYWLNFVEKGKRKISYAASMSTNDIPESLYPRIRELLSDYKAISVREKQDKELLDKILGEGRVQWVLDPTLLLSRAEWEEICEENPFKGKPYVFVYLLGESKKQRRFVTEWAKKNNKTIITIPYLLGQYRSCDRKFGDIRKSDVTPNLWLSLIRDADCVFTDSFHACVFSSIFHTPFYVFKRCKDSSKESMNSRIYSLMQLFDTEDRIIEDTAPINSYPKLESVDFDKIDSQVVVEKEKSINFLKKAIEE